MKISDNLGKYARVLGYILSIGALLGLIAYGIYRLVPKIAPYLTRPFFLIAVVGIFGVLLITLSLIIERLNEDR